MVRAAAAVEDAASLGTFQNFPTLLGWFSDFVGCSYYCTVVDGKRGCCPNGKTCKCEPPKCKHPNYDLCPDKKFCCRASTLIAMNRPILLNLFHLQPREPNATGTLTVNPVAAHPPLAHQSEGRLLGLGILTQSDRTPMISLLCKYTFVISFYGSLRLLDFFSFS